jgi:hypothetical protein
MREVVFRIGGVGLGLGAGLAWGWISGRVFSRSLVQDLSAVLIGTMLGSLIVVGAEIGSLAFSSPGGGLGAVSGGVSELVLIGLPVATAFAVIASHLVRQRLESVAAVPIVLGGLGAILGALWVAATISSSAS